MWTNTEPTQPDFWWCLSTMGVECAELRASDGTIEDAGGATWNYPRSRIRWIVPPDALWWSIRAEVPEIQP